MQKEQTSRLGANSIGVSTCLTSVALLLREIRPLASKASVTAVMLQMLFTPVEHSSASGATSVNATRAHMRIIFPCNATVQFCSNVATGGRYWTLQWCTH